MVKEVGLSKVMTAWLVTCDCAMLQTVSVIGPDVSWGECDCGEQEPVNAHGIPREPKRMG